MLATKAPQFCGAQGAVVPTSALADVVEQGGHVQNPRLVPACRQLRATGVFMRMLGHEKAAHVAHHHQDVLVDRVDVEQIVLHLPDDASKYP